MMVMVCGGGMEEDETASRVGERLSRGACRGNPVGGGGGRQGRRSRCGGMGASGVQGVPHSRRIKNEVFLLLNT